MNEHERRKQLLFQVEVSIGDKVEIYDGSYSTEVIDGEIRPTSGNICCYTDDNGKDKYYHYVVVGTGNNLPTRISYGEGKVPKNNVIVQGNGRVIFTQLRFLRPYVKLCPCCNRPL